MSVFKRLRQTVAVAAVLTIGPTAALAFEPANEAERLLVGWFEEAGCAMPQKDFMEGMLSGTPIPRSELMRARRAMTKAGALARGEGSMLTLTAGAACGDGAAETAAPAAAPNTAPNTAAVAVATGGDDRARIMAMFEANGCALSESQLPDVAAQFKVTRKQFRPVARAMEKAGELVEDGDRIILKAGSLCPGDSGGPVVQTATVEDTPQAASRAMVAAMEQGGCRITEEMAVSLGKDQGFSASSIDDAFDLLEDNGSIVIAPDRRSARLVTGETCAKAEQAAIAGFQPKTDDERRVMQLFEENGCTLSEDQLPELASKYGIERAAFRTAGRAMMKAGVFVEKNDVITLKAGRCAAGAKPEQQSAAVNPVSSRSVVLAAIEKNGCSLTRREARALPEATGVAAAEVEAMLDALVTSGAATRNALTRVITLEAGDVCGTPPPDPVVLSIRSAFEANECALTEEIFVAAMERDGHDLDSAGERVEAMLDAGDVVFDEDVDKVRMTVGDICGK